MTSSSNICKDGEWGILTCKVWTRGSDHKTPLPSSAASWQHTQPRDKQHLCFLNTCIPSHTVIHNYCIYYMQVLSAPQELSAPFVEEPGCTRQSLHVKATRALYVLNTNTQKHAWTLSRTPSASLCRMLPHSLQRDCQGSALLQDTSSTQPPFTAILQCTVPLARLVEAQLLVSVTDVLCSRAQNWQVLTTFDGNLTQMLLSQHNVTWKEKQTLLQLYRRFLMLS